MTDTTFDWANFYQNLITQTQIPATQSASYTNNQVIVRDLFVDINDVFAQIRSKNLSPASISIYADVAKLSHVTDPLLSNSGLLIVARLIEVDAGANIFLDYRQNQTAKLAVYKQQVVGKLQAQAITLANGKPVNTPFDLSSTETLGVYVANRNNAPFLGTLPNFDDSGFGFGTPMQMALAASFQVATALFTSNPDIAAQILYWLVATTKGSLLAYATHLQSVALLGQLQAATSAVTFVPYLDKDIYADVATSFVNAAQAYETQFQRFTDRSLSVDKWVDNANLMLQSYQDTIQFNNQLIKQAQTNLKSAQDANLKAGYALKAQQSVVQDAAIGFKYESKIWAREQIIDAVFKITLALTEFVIGIAAMAVGDEAGGAQAGEAVAQGVAAAQDAAEVAEQVQEVSGFAKTMDNLAKAMKKLDGVADLIGKINEIITEVVAASNITNPSEGVDITLPKNAEALDADTQWDIFRLEADALLKPAVDLEVPGALEYQLEMDKMSIMGKAVMASQIATIRSGQELAQLYLQKQNNVKQEARIKQLITKLQKEQQYDDEMTQLFFERELNIKRWLFIALQNYTWAYRYWALRDSRVALSIVQPVENFTEDLATIKQEYADAFSSFNPPPQDFRGISITVPDTTSGIYSNVVANLRQNMTTSLVIDMNDEAFLGLGRVRITTVRVWLQGVQATEAVPFYINFGTTGVYSDRLNDATFTFTAAPLSQIFKYQGDVGDVNKILVDGQIDERDRYVYFMPTPFTQWSITLPRNYNTKVDLSKLTGIRLEFSGSANATLTTLKARSNA